MADGLRFDELREINVKRCEDHFHPLSDWSLTDWLTCVAGEVGELASEIKALRRKNVDGCTRRSWHPLGNEAADVVIYLDLLCVKAGVDLGAAVRRKFNEVSAAIGPDAPTLPTWMHGNRATVIIDDVAKWAVCVRCDSPYTPVGGCSRKDCQGGRWENPHKRPDKEAVKDFAQRVQSPSPRVQRAIRRVRAYFGPSTAPNGAGNGDADGDAWDEVRVLIDALECKEPPAPERCLECDVEAHFDKLANHWAMRHHDVHCSLKPMVVVMVPRFYPGDKPSVHCRNCNGRLKHDEVSCPWCGFPVVAPS